MPFYEKGDVRIRYEEAGAGFPLLIIAGGGLNSAISYFTGMAPFNAIEEFKDQYRCITMDLRNAKDGQSAGPLEIDRPWDAYADDHLGLMDHLGIKQFLVMGFCIGGPFIWNLLKRAPERIVAAVLAQPSGFRPEMPDLFFNNNVANWGPALCARRPEITMAMVDVLPEQDVPNQRRLCFHRDTRFRARLQDADTGTAGRRPRAPVRSGHGVGTSRAQRASEPVPLAGTQEPDSPRGASRAHLPPGASTCAMTAMSSPALVGSASCRR